MHSDPWAVSMLHEGLRAYGKGFIYGFCGGHVS